MNLDKNSPIPLYHQLKEVILELIESGELKADDQLPSETLIADRYDINRLTVRRAIDELVKDGILYRERGKGTFVAKVMEDNLAKSLSKEVETAKESEPLAAIGLIVPYMNTMFWFDVVRGVESAIGHGRYHVIFYRTDDDPDLEIHYLERLKEDGVKGAVVFSSHRSKLTAGWICEMERSGFSIVCVDRYPSGGKVDYVVSDNEGGAFAATEHLIKLGHTRIGHITTEFGGLSPVAARLSGYRRALEAYGVRFDPSLVQVGEHGMDKTGFHTGYDAMKKLLALGENRPTAVFALTDYLAVGAMKAIREAGLKVPEDIALVGFDNLDIAEFAEVPLTTVEQQVWEMGRRAGEMLIEKVESAPLVGRMSPRQVVLETRLVVRESCGARRMGQRSVAP